MTSLLKGMFTEDIPSYGITGGIEAFYPANLKTDDGYVWPAVQVNNQVPPMYAHQTISGTGDETVSFSSLGAMYSPVGIRSMNACPKISGTSNLTRCTGI